MDTHRDSADSTCSSEAAPPSEFSCDDDWQDPGTGLAAGYTTPQVLPQGKCYETDKVGTPLLIQIHLPAIDIQSMISIDLRLSCRNRLLERMGCVVDAVLATYGDDVAYWNQDLTERTIFATQQRAQKELGEWYEKLRLAEECKARVDRFEAQMMRMREAYYKDIFHLRQQIAEKKKAEKNQRTFQVSWVTHFDPSQYSAKEELSLLLQEKAALMQQELDAKLIDMENRHARQLADLKEKLSNRNFLMERKDDFYKHKLKRSGARSLDDELADEAPLEEKTQCDDPEGQASPRGSSIPAQDGSQQADHQDASTCLTRSRTNSGVASGASSGASTGTEPQDHPQKAEVAEEASPASHRSPPPAKDDGQPPQPTVVVPRPNKILCELPDDGEAAFCERAAKPHKVLCELPGDDEAAFCECVSQPKKVLCKLPAGGKEEERPPKMSTLQPHAPSPRRWSINPLSSSFFGRHLTLSGNDVQNPEPRDVTPSPCATRPASRRTSMLQTILQKAAPSGLGGTPERRMSMRDAEVQVHPWADVADEQTATTLVDRLPGGNEMPMVQFKGLGAILAEIEECMPILRQRLSALRPKKGKPTSVTEVSAWQITSLLYRMSNLGSINDAKPKDKTPGRSSSGSFSPTPSNPPGSVQAPDSSWSSRDMLRDKEKFVPSVEGILQQHGVNTDDVPDVPEDPKLQGSANKQLATKVPLRHQATTDFSTRNPHTSQSSPKASWTVASSQSFASPQGKGTLPPLELIGMVPSVKTAPAPDAFPDVMDKATTPMSSSSMLPGALRVTGPTPVPSSSSSVVPGAAPANSRRGISSRLNPLRRAAPAASSSGGAKAESRLATVRGSVKHNS